MGRPNPNSVNEESRKRAEMLRARAEAIALQSPTPIGRSAPTVAHPEQRPDQIKAGVNPTNDPEVLLRQAEYRFATEQLQQLYRTERQEVAEHEKTIGRSLSVDERVLFLATNANLGSRLSPKKARSLLQARDMQVLSERHSFTGGGAKARGANQSKRGFVDRTPDLLKKAATHDIQIQSQSLQTKSGIRRSGDQATRASILTSPKGLQENNLLGKRTKL